MKKTAIIFLALLLCLSLVSCNMLAENNNGDRAVEKHESDTPAPAGQTKEPTPDAEKAQQPEETGEKGEIGENGSENNANNGINMPKISIRYNGEIYSCVTESSDGYISLGKDAEGNETVAEIHGIYLEELYKGELPENCQVIKYTGGELEIIDDGWYEREITKGFCALGGDGNGPKPLDKAPTEKGTYLYRIVTKKTSPMFDKSITPETNVFYGTVTYYVAIVIE